MALITEEDKRERRGWRYYGQERPVFAVSPREGQESVWDYPRPPRVERTLREVTVRAGTTEIAHSRRCLRVLETASPPTFYLPPEDVRLEFLEPTPARSRCEWKGEARYWTIKVPGLLLERVAWSYPDPLPGFEAIRDYWSFYPARVTCYIDSVKIHSAMATTFTLLLIGFILLDLAHFGYPGIS
jgi:uncharacterized protein (DUF427 family)